MSNSDGPVNDDACRIRREIEALKNEKIEIDRKISDLEALLRGLKSENEAAGDTDSNGFGHGLSPDLIYRHSRHLMLPSFGIQGQSKLSKSSVLVVGAGGLGSPALLYLAACGVGRIGIVDHDVVELNNLHRQDKLTAKEISTWLSVTNQEENIARGLYPHYATRVQPTSPRLPMATKEVEPLSPKINVFVEGHSAAVSMIKEIQVLDPDAVIHTEEYIGRPKVESAAAACLKINSTVQITKHQEALRTTNALEIVSKYDIVIDATDNAPSRYLINDCCVVLGKPLVSGAAIGMEGQLTVYNYKEGPCYRCLFPTPPPTTACQRCSDSGVLGVVPGIIGCLQALEAIKIASSVGEPLSGRMLLLDSLSTKIRIVSDCQLLCLFWRFAKCCYGRGIGEGFRLEVKIRGRSAHCEVCGGKSVFTPQQFKDIDYEKFTMTPLSVAPVKLNLLTPDFRITANEYKERIVQEEAHVLVDVRPEHHFTIVSLPNALNIPLSTMEQRVGEISSALKEKELNNSDSGVESGFLRIFFKSTCSPPDVHQPIMVEAIESLIVPPVAIFLRSSPVVCDKLTFSDPSAYKSTEEGCDNEMICSPASLFSIECEENEIPILATAIGEGGEDAEEISELELFITAADFIGKFYKQLKMQREESWNSLQDFSIKA
ncbi:unnamed protein product [Rhodiola kirilowii]